MRSRGAAAPEGHLGDSGPAATRQSNSGLALLNLAIDSKLRPCDLVKPRVRDLVHGERIAARAIVMQQKTQRPVQFEITKQTREALGTWVRQRGLRGDDFLFPSRLRRSPHLSTPARAQHLGIEVDDALEMAEQRCSLGLGPVRRSAAPLGR